MLGEGSDNAIVVVKEGWMVVMTSVIRYYPLQ